MSHPATSAASDPSAGWVEPAFLDSAVATAERLAIECLRRIAEVAGRMAAPGAKSNPGDWVTETDRGLEVHTRAILAEATPDIPVLGEEMSAPDAAALLPGTPGGPDLLWIVDPVDGTANYVAGLPWCCYSLGLVDANGPLLGVIGDPYVGEVHSAVRGRGTTTLTLSSELRRPPPPAATRLSGSLIAVEPSRDGSRPDLSALMVRCRQSYVGLRIFGSTALAITQAALGRVAATLLPTSGYASWDVAGALALALESGLTLTELGPEPSKGPLPMSGFLVSAPSVTDDVLTLLSGS